MDDAAVYFSNLLLTEHDLTPPLGLGGVSLLCRVHGLRVSRARHQRQPALYVDGSDRWQPFRAVLLREDATAHDLAHELLHHLLATADPDLLALFRPECEEAASHRFAELLCGPPAAKEVPPLPEPPPPYRRRIPQPEVQEPPANLPPGVSPDLVRILELWKAEKDEDDRRRSFWRDLGRG